MLYQYDNQAYEPSDLSQLSEQQMQQADWGYAALDEDGVPSTDGDGNYIFSIPSPGNSKELLVLQFKQEFLKFSLCEQW